MTIPKESVQKLIKWLRFLTKDFYQPTDQTVEPVTLRLPDGTPVMELTSSCKGTWRERPVLFVEPTVTALENVKTILDAGIQVDVKFLPK